MCASDGFATLPVFRRGCLAARTGSMLQGAPKVLNEEKWHPTHPAVGGCECAMVGILKTSLYPFFSLPLSISLSLFLHYLVVVLILRICER